MTPKDASVQFEKVGMGKRLTSCHSWIRAGVDDDDLLSCQHDL